MAKKKKKSSRKPMTDKELQEHLKTNKSKTWGGKPSAKESRRKSRLKLKNKF